MFIDHQLKWRPIIIAGTIIAVLAWSVFLVIAGVELSDIFGSLPKLGVVSLIVWLTWMTFTKAAWRWKWLRFRGLLLATPDLNGRWVGKYVSSRNKREKRPMTLEICQTLLTVKCVAFGPGNTARGYSARLLSDPGSHRFGLAYLYHAKREVATSVTGDEHEGVAILTLIDASPRQLKGFYINDRDPEPRKGDIDLTWESFGLKGHL